METGRSSKRLQSTHEEAIDFISDLPDHILVHILSFLPTRDAIKTVLLRRFGNLWRTVPVLDLNGCLHRGCMGFEARDGQKFGCIIHHVSNLHNVRILDKLNLNFCFAFTFSNNDASSYGFDIGDYLEMEKATSLTKQLVGYALNRKVKVLNLNFAGCRFVRRLEFYVLPDVFRSNYLTDIRLHACDIKSCRAISLKALRVLSLHRVALSDEIMEIILLGCPILEDLSLIDCYGLGKLYCENANMKKLMLKLGSNEKKLLHVSCPHVTSLEIAYWIVGTTLLDVSHVAVDTSISLHCISVCKWGVYDDVQSLLLMISQCKTLTLCGSTISEIADTVEKIS